MSIIIKQDVFAYPKKKQADQGFALVELVMVMAIFSLFFGCLWQGAVVAMQSQRNSAEKQDILYLVEQLYTGQAVESQGQLKYRITETNYSQHLVEKSIYIENQRGQYWKFYYLQEKIS